MVTAELGYLGRSGERPFDYAYPPPPGTPWRNYRIDARPVQIADARKLPSEPTLAREGFRLCEAPTALRDFSDDERVKRVYYAEIAELACAATGARSAYVFDHLLRKRTPGEAALDFGRRGKPHTPSANGRVHNDYTARSGPRRMAQVLEEKAAGIRRYAIVNVWRPAKSPVLDAPLALCDARSVSAHDLVAGDVHYATRTGEIYLVAYSPRHRWFYFPRMRTDEALVFKQYDSIDGGAAAVPHAAFVDPDTPPDAPLRESIEARCLVVF